MIYPPDFFLFSIPEEHTFHPFGVNDYTSCSQLACGVAPKRKSNITVRGEKIKIQTWTQICRVKTCCYGIPWKRQSHMVTPLPREPRVGTGFGNTGPSSRYTNGLLNVQGGGRRGCVGEEFQSNT